MDSNGNTIVRKQANKQTQKTRCLLIAQLEVLISNNLIKVIKKSMEIHLDIFK